MISCVPKVAFRVLVRGLESHEEPSKAEPLAGYRDHFDSLSGIRLLWVLVGSALRASLQGRPRPGDCTGTTSCVGSAVNGLCGWGSGHAGP